MYNEYMIVVHCKGGLHNEESASIFIDRQHCLFDLEFPFCRRCRRDTRRTLHIRRDTRGSGRAQTGSVPEDKIDGLVYKLQHDIPWDSFNKKYKDLKPQIVMDGYQKTIYPDGSFLVSGIAPNKQQPNEEIERPTLPVEDEGTHNGAYDSASFPGTDF